MALKLQRIYSESLKDTSKLAFETEVIPEQHKQAIELYKQEQAILFEQQYKPSTSNSGSAFTETINSEKEDSNRPKEWSEEHFQKFYDAIELYKDH
mgnify:CR=1 FL=1